MKAAVEQIFNSVIPDVTVYDQTKVTIPPAPSLIRQWNLGSNPGDKFLGPNPVVVARPNEQSVAIPANFVHVVQWSATQWWVFYSDNAAAAATRRVGLYWFDPVANTMTWKGFVTLTPPTATAHTIRGFRALHSTYITGTVQVATTAVTGSGTSWQTARLAVGSRIGFGSTDPTAISTWYEISAIGSNTSITLTASAGTIAAGTAYVIEELRLAITTTNATATNGGLFVAKGLRVENFTTIGTTIPAATTVDNIRAVMWLRDAATLTNTAAGGLSLRNPVSDTLHECVVSNGAATSLILYKYNLRAALTLASGGATLSGGDLVVTGTQTVTGNLSQNGNGRIDTLGHGPGAGVESLYLVTTTRVYRIAVANIVAASTTFVSDVMTEVPPGGVNTYAAFGSFANVEVSNSLDRLILSNGNTVRHYVTQYRTDAGQFSHIFLTDTRQQDQASAAATAVPHLNAAQPPGAGAVPLYFWAEGGFLFAVRQNTAASVNQIYVVPIGAHWTYTATTLQRAIFPVIALGATPAKFYRVLHQNVDHLGNIEFGKATEPFRLLYRTSGISDNSGAWTLVPEDGDLSGVLAASSIQFAAEFKTIGDLCIPGRLVSLALLYETADDLPSQYRWNHADFNPTTGVFAWVQATTFGSGPGVHTINIYRADTNALVLTQASSGTTNGTFEYWNGSAWTAGIGPDTIGTRRRFVPTAGLPSGVDLYAAITVA